MTDIATKNTASSYVPQGMRFDRNIIYHTHQILPKDSYDISLDILFFVAHLIQTQLTQLFGLDAGIRFTVSDFCKYTGRSTAQLQKADKEWRLPYYINGQEATLSSVFDKALFHFVNAPLPIHKIYSHGYFKDKPALGLKMQRLFEDVRIDVYNNQSRQRVYILIPGDFFSESLLHQFIHIDYKAIKEIKGKNAPKELGIYIMRLVNEQAFKKKNQFVIEYPIMREMINVNIVSGTHSENVSLTHQKIKQKLQTLQKGKHFPKFSWKRLNNNNYLITLPDPSVNLVLSPKKNALFIQHNILQDKIAKYFAVQKKESIPELSDKEREDLLDILCLHYHNPRKDAEFHHEFVKMIQAFFQEDAPAPFVITERLKLVQQEKKTLS